MMDHPDIIQYQNNGALNNDLIPAGYCESCETPHFEGDELVVFESHYFCDSECAIEFFANHVDALTQREEV